MSRALLAVTVGAKRLASSASPRKPLAWSRLLCHHPPGGGACLMAVNPSRDRRLCQRADQPGLRGQVSFREALHDCPHEHLAARALGRREAHQPGPGLPLRARRGLLQARQPRAGAGRRSRRDRKGRRLHRAVPLGVRVRHAVGGQVRRAPRKPRCQGARLPGAAGRTWSTPCSRRRPPHPTPR